MLSPHTNSWYERLATQQEGYFYPWHSSLGEFNGEDAYLQMLRQHLSMDKDVLDAGCGHGDVALEIARFCRHVTAYDRIPQYITLAQANAQKQGAAQKRGITNVTFLCADSSTTVNGGTGRIPAEPASIDLLISRRGPLNWIEDARRVARPGAVLLQLNPLENPSGIPAWNNELPEVLRLQIHTLDMRAVIEDRLAKGGLRLHSAWVFDVPETFADPYQLYVFLSWGLGPGEAPTWEETRPLIERIFATHGRSGQLELRHRRLLWKAVVT